MDVRVLTWNLYHGRDGPPDKALYTRRSGWLKRTERNGTHVQVNRNLYREFARMLDGASWDAALLQECPPRWNRPFARDCHAAAYRSLTSRNWGLPITSLLARWNPDLLGSSEGGSNMILARGGAGDVIEGRSLTLRFPRPERRTMAFARLRCGLCVTSLHASTTYDYAVPELLNAAERAVEWADGAPLVLGGDFNVRSVKNDVYERIRDRFGLCCVTAPDAIDHLLVRDAEVLEPPRAWPPEARELREQGLALRLSDHAPVEALVRIP